MRSHFGAALFFVWVINSVAFGETPCPTLSAPGLRLIPGTTAGLVHVVPAKKQPSTTLLVSGHPLRPHIQIVASDGSLRDCKPPSDVTALFATAIIDSRTKSAIGEWRRWLIRQPKACSPMVDSVGYFQPGATKIAVLFHGLSSSPQSLRPLVQTFLDEGYNVLVPRLARHFTLDPLDLDHAEYAEWIKDSEKVYALALNFLASPRGQVTVGGYSLGGLLAARLGVKYGPTNVDRLVLLAPALRMNATASEASILGSLLNQSYNDYAHIPTACKAGQGHLPANAGRVVENMIGAVESELGTPHSPQIPIVYNNIIVPYLVVTDPGDIAIDAKAISDQCRLRHLVCTDVSTADVAHEHLMDALDQKSAAPPGPTLRESIVEFLRRPIIQE